MSLIPNTRPLSAPFLFRGYPDLVGEMGLDELFLTRPGSASEAAEIGFLFPHTFEPKDPLGSIERILSKYKGPSERYIFFAISRKDSREPIFVVLDKSGVRRPIQKEGIFEYFLSSISKFLVSNGYSEEMVKKNLCPAKPDHASLSTWMIGYERSTGYTTIIDCSGGYEVNQAFLRGENNLPLLCVPAKEQR